MEQSKKRFELRRHIDNLVYTFERIEGEHGLIGYKRTDGEHWIVCHKRLGWIAGRQDSEDVFGRPWNTPPAAQENHPPEGIWVSRKGPKSYVYDLVYVQDD